MPTNINDPDEIIRAVGRQEEQTRPLRDRMEGDFRLYRLEPFQEVDGYGHPVEGFRSYTSNAPQVYADKVIQWIARAEFGIRIPQAGRTGAQRAVDALKEKWTWGLMRAVDRRIQQRMEPPMRDLTAFHNVVRGMVAGRWLMMNTASDETVVDMTPWDPMHTYWSVGTEGLALGVLQGPQDARGDPVGVRRGRRGGHRHAQGGSAGRRRGGDGGVRLLRPDVQHRGCGQRGGAEEADAAWCRAECRW